MVDPSSIQPAHAFPMSDGASPDRREAASFAVDAFGTDGQVNQQQSHAKSAVNKFLTGGSDEAAYRRWRSPRSARSSRSTCSCRCETKWFRRTRKSCACRCRARYMDQLKRTVLAPDAQYSESPLSRAAAVRGALGAPWLIALDQESDFQPLYTGLAPGGCGGRRSEAERERRRSSGFPRAGRRCSVPSRA